MHLSVEHKENTNSSWVLFEKPQAIQIESTQKLYQASILGEEFSPQKSNDFIDYITSKSNKYQISEKYNEFYDNRYLAEINPLKVLEQKGDSLNFEEIYNKKSVQLFKNIENNKVDFDMLIRIRTKQIKSKFFEFDGVKYQRKDAPELIKDLKKEILQLEVQTKKLDELAFLFNYNVAKTAGEQNNYLGKYQHILELLELLKKSEGINNRFNNFSMWLSSLKFMSEDDMKLSSVELFSIEKDFKKFVTVLVKIDLDKIFEEQDLKASLTEYGSSKNYMTKSYEFENDVTEFIINLSNTIHYNLSSAYNKDLKNLTDYQLRFYN